MQAYYEVIGPASVAAVGLIQLEDVNTFSQLLQLDKIGTVGILVFAVYWFHNQLARQKEENKDLQAKNLELEKKVAKYEALEEVRKIKEME